MHSQPRDPHALQRNPEAMAMPGLRELSVLPVFYKLAGKKIVVCGNSLAASWKVELLAATGAALEVFSTAPHERIQVAARDMTNVSLQNRAWSPADFEHAVLVIAETGDAEEAESLHQHVRAAGAHLNIIDKPVWSTFQFGAIVERSPLVIAISTDGAAPVFAQNIRARIETLFPDGLRNWAAAAKNWRPKVAALQLDIHGRRQIWQAFTRLAFAHPDRRPAPEDLLAIIPVDGSVNATTPTTGTVSLVGAGPGDPELLTLRALRALQSADAILFDDLVSPQVLDLARREADKISVGKRGFKPSCTQDDICGLMISLAREGKYVVRLKGGDPMIFGRANEEISALEAAGIPVSVVPGVTAASAAAASLGISLTERSFARRVQFVTAHARGGVLPDDINWPALADPLATTIVYMGVRTLPDFMAGLIAHGLPPDTPAILVERASHAAQRQFSATIATLPADVESASVKGPALVIVGQIARSRIPAGQIKLGRNDHIVS